MAMGAVASNSILDDLLEYQFDDDDGEGEFLPAGGSSRRASSGRGAIASVNSSSPSVPSSSGVSMLASSSGSAGASSSGLAAASASGASRRVNGASPSLAVRASGSGTSGGAAVGSRGPVSSSSRSGSNSTGNPVPNSWASKVAGSNYFRIPKKTPAPVTPTLVLDPAPQRVYHGLPSNLELFDVNNGPPLQIAQGADNRAFGYCDCRVGPLAVTGKVQHGELQGYHQVREFRAKLVPNNTEPYVTFDIVTGCHIGRGKHLPSNPAALAVKTTKDITTGNHILFVDLAYASRIQLTPMDRTARVNRTRSGIWEWMKESGLPPVQDWRKHGSTYEELYHRKLWHVSFKGEFLLNWMVDLGLTHLDNYYCFPEKKLFLFTTCLVDKLKR